MSDITVTATSTPITATASSSGVLAAVSSSTVSASAGGGIGPQGPTGPTGPAGTGGGSAYTLPAASSSTLGGVKIGANVSAASDGTISVAAPTTSLAASAVTGLASVATSGAYSDLSGKPSIPAAVTSLPAASITGLAAVATTGAYADLSGKPTIPAATTSLPATSITGLATVATSGAYSDLSGKPTIPGAYSLPAASSSVLGGVKAGTNVTVAADGTISVAGPTTTLAAGSITGLATVATSGAYADLSGRPTLGTAAAAATGDFAAASHTHALANLTQSSATTGQVPTWSGTAWAPATPAAPTTDASALTSGTLPDARLSANVVTTATLTASSNQSTSVVDVIDRATVTTTRAPNSGTIFFSFFSPVSNVTISSISMATASTVASSVTLARMGLYTWDGTTLTLVARTASDTTLFTTSATVYTRSFDTTGSYPSSYALAAGTRYAVAVVVVASSVGTLLAGNAPNTLAGLTPRVQAARSGVSDLSTSVSSFQATADTIIWARLS